VQYHHCCHSNLTRAVAAGLGVSLAEADPHVHDVLNIFMCTGFTRDTGRYFMKASPGGDCSSKHKSDAAACQGRIARRMAQPGAQRL